MSVSHDSRQTLNSHRITIHVTAHSRLHCDLRANEANEGSGPRPEITLAGALHGTSTKYAAASCGLGWRFDPCLEMDARSRTTDGRRSFFVAGKIPTLTDLPRSSFHRFSAWLSPVPFARGVPLGPVNRVRPKIGSHGPLRCDLRAAPPLPPGSVYIIDASGTQPAQQPERSSLAFVAHSAVTRRLT